MIENKCWNDSPQKDNFFEQWWTCGRSRKRAAIWAPSKQGSHMVYLIRSAPFKARWMTYPLHSVQNLPINGLRTKRQGWVFTLSHSNAFFAEQKKPTTHTWARMCASSVSTRCLLEALHFRVVKQKVLGSLCSISKKVIIISSWPQQRLSLHYLDISQKTGHDWKQQRMCD